jgi:hypothetical protein
MQGYNLMNPCQSHETILHSQAQFSLCFNILGHIITKGGMHIEPSLVSALEDLANDKATKSRQIISNNSFDNNPQSLQMALSMFWMLASHPKITSELDMLG